MKPAAAPLWFLLGLVLVCPSQASWAQRPTTARNSQSPRITLMIAEWTRAKDWTLKYIDAMPEQHFGFKPVPEVRSFAEQMLHLAYWNYGFNDKVFGTSQPFTEDQLLTGNFQTKAALTKVVADSYDF